MNPTKPRKCLQHILIFEEWRQDTLLDIERIVRWERTHGIALLVCSNLEGLKFFAAHFSVDLAIVVRNARDHKASLAIKHLRTAGITCPAIPEVFLPTGYFDRATLQPLSPELVFARPLDFSTKGFARVVSAINWPGFLTLNM